MFEVRVSEDAERHLKNFSARDQGVLLRAIEEQLTHQPTVSTRDRKQLCANPLCCASRCGSRWRPRDSQQSTIQGRESAQSLVNSASEGNAVIISSANNDAEVRGR